MAGMSKANQHKKSHYKNKYAGQFEITRKNKIKAWEKAVEKYGDKHPAAKKLRGV